MKMKKIVSSLLVLVMGLSLLAGCGDKSTQEVDGKEEVVV